MGLLEDSLNQISSSNKEIEDSTREYWDSLGKPLGSLGTLEELCIRISGMTGTRNNKLDKKAILVFAGDNGIYEENIASSPQVFTKILVENTAKGVTGVATLAKHAKSDVFVIDLGTNADMDNEKYPFIDRKIAYGTKNFTKELAMTREETIKAIETGIEITDELCDKGYNLLGVGELGIGNTTTSSAVLSALTGLPVETTCGLGSGLTSEQFMLKKNVIEKGLELHRPDSKDSVDILSKVGGFDIAGMCGAYISAAKNKTPIVMDGFISTVAALCAINLNPDVKDYLITSHLSEEAGAEYVYKELDMEPMLNMKMRLGEGSGCPLAFNIIESAIFTQENLATFKELDIDSSILLDMREDN